MGLDTCLIGGSFKGLTLACNAGFSVTATFQDLQNGHGSDGLTDSTGITNSIADRIF